MKIETPSPKIVKEYLKRWNTLENYVAQESSLRKLFTKTYPLNNDLDEVLIKVCSLNDFYSTNIFSPFSVAKHIISLNIDDRLEKNDMSLVDDIARVNVNGIREIYFYSFATKYCSHHKPLYYPIYDNYVEKLLMYFKKQNKSFKYTKKDLKTYPKYKEILLTFQSYYNLQEFNLKELDKYLWQCGKKHFSKKKNKNAEDRLTYKSDLGLRKIN
ncbi:MAG: hypothetical protein V2I54_02890 [Bacteroidales bacterium]|jgi:hypothetical protein|nr:hypothetical protein [Bacteroidales bacterium]